MNDFFQKLGYLVVVFLIGNILINIFNNSTVTKMIYYLIGYIACIICNFDKIFKGDK